MRSLLIDNIRRRSPYCSSFQDSPSMKPLEKTALLHENFIAAFSPRMTLMSITGRCFVLYAQVVSRCSE